MSGELLVGVIGLGHGANHARVLHELPGARLTAVCDLDQDRLAAAAQGRQIQAYTEYERMLDKEKLDAVVVAVPAKLHEAVTLCAIQAGCSVLVEKPLAPSVVEARRLISASEAASVTLMPGHIERFNPAVIELKKRLAAGDIGVPLSLSSRRMGPIVIRTLGPDVNVVYDTAIHDIDILRYLLTAEVERVFAETRCDLGLPFEDSVNALLRLSAQLEARHSGGGPTATIDANWLASRRVRDLIVRGSDGTFVLDYMAQTLNLYPGRATLERPSANALLRMEPSSIPIEQEEPLLGELRAFISAVRGSAPPPVTADDALTALAVCDAITESARTGQPVVPKRVL
jgi:predicted dehydrogenase